jgi:hypothetical protein
MMTPQPPAIFHVDGMRVACTPYDAISQSTLECLCDPVCLNVTTQLISSLPNTAWPKPLNSSIPSNFPLNSSISMLLDSMMVEEWKINNDFSQYYNACAPLQCTYTFTKRNDFIYVITLLIGLFGGLIAILRIAAPTIVKVARKIYRHFSTRNEPEPQNTQPGINSAAFTNYFKNTMINMDRFYVF